MPLTREDVEDMVFGTTRAQRFTQDSPVLPDVWVEYAIRGAHKPVDLLLTPNRHSSPAELAEWLAKRLKVERASTHWRTLHAASPTPARLTYNESYVVAALWFDELVRAALPLTGWWRNYVWGRSAHLTPEALADTAAREGLARQIESGANGDSSEDLLWMAQLIGRIEWERSRQAGAPTAKGKGKAPAQKPPTGEKPSPAELVRAFGDLLGGMNLDAGPEKPVLWSVSLNRPVRMAIWRSVMATKADAATRLFNLSCMRLRWAVVDSGIDATHPAFRRRDVTKPDQPIFPEPFAGGKGTRVVATYDFTRLRRFLTIEVDDDQPRPEHDGATADARRGGRRKAPAGPSKAGRVPTESPGKSG